MNISQEDLALIKRVAWKTIWRYRRTLGQYWYGFEDANSEVILACIEALQKYDPTKATKKTYMFNIARWVILHIAYKEKMKEKWIGEYKYKIDILTIQNADTEEDGLELIRELMLLPSIRQRRFITKWCEGFTLRDIGKQEGLTCERVRQVIAKGLWTIKSRAKAIASRMQMSFDDLGKELIHQASFDSHYK